MCEILNSRKHSWRVWITSDSVAKHGQSLGLFIIANMFFQYVPKFWHVECWSILSIAHLSASNFVCRATSRFLKFRVPISWIFPKLSIQTHLYPLNWDVEVHEPSTKQILLKLKTCGSSIACSCGDEGIFSFALNKLGIQLSHIWPAPKDLYLPP